jgi:glycosyltransferase involved in cell wall biosynthesis
MTRFRKISIIIPCRNEEAHIDEAVSSILASLEGLPAEVLVCDGASTDGTADRVRAMAAQDSRVHLVENPARFTPHGMNAGLAVAVGDPIFIISAHAFYPPGYFQGLSEALGRLGAACVGGILRTEVKVETAVARSIRAVLGDSFGVGNAHYRTGVRNEREVDTVAFGCYPRWAFERFGTYDERLLRNQDIELNKRILAGGGTIWLVPDVEAVYYARPRLAAFLANQFQNGRWNLLTIALTGSLTSVSLRHLVPAMFVLGILIPSLLGFLHPLWALPALVTLLAYLPIAMWRSFRLQREGAQPGMTLAIFFLLHMAYGLGSLAGMFQAPFYWRPRFA